MSRHSFDPAVAQEVGLAAAVIYQNIYWWIERNAANGHNLHDGRYWTHNSVAAFADLFPYLTDKQIRTAIDKLEEAGLIVSGNYNDSPYLRTKWYALGRPATGCHLPVWANGFEAKGKTYKDTVSKPVITNPPTPQGGSANAVSEPEEGAPSEQSLAQEGSGKQGRGRSRRPVDYDDAFQTFWRSWPEARRTVSDKRKAFDRWKAAVAQYGADKVQSAAARYLAKPDVRKDNWRYCCLAEVFLNGKLEAAIEAVDAVAARATAATGDRAAHYGAERWARMVLAFDRQGIWDASRGPQPTARDIAWARSQTGASA